MLAYDIDISYHNLHLNVQKICSSELPEYVIKNHFET